MQVSVATVKPRITKRTNGDYGAQRERHRLRLLHARAHLPVRTQSSQRHQHFGVVREAIKVISCFKTT